MTWISCNNCADDLIGGPIACQMCVLSGMGEGETQREMKFTVRIIPKGQRRTRAGIVKGHARVFKDAEQVREEQCLESLLALHKPPVPLDGPLLLGVRAYLPIPASKPKKWKAAAEAGRIRPTVKPDMDNLLKHLKDCLTDMRFWKDDKLVVGYLPGTGKYYGEEPRWEIEIRSLEEGI